MYLKLKSYFKMWFTQLNYRQLTNMMTINLYV